MSRDDFDEGQIDALSLEVIGGNHRREALSQLIKEGKLNTTYTIVQLYTEMPSQDALRLAQMHNRVDTMHHNLTTADKIILCKKILVDKFQKNKCSEWRIMCSTILRESESALAHVLFISSDVSEEVFELVLSMISMFMKMELKGQRASKKCLQSGISHLDLPYYKLKCMRGSLTEEELKSVITEVIAKEKSLHEMEAEFVRLKEMRALQNFFIRHSNCESWKEAQERFPLFTTEEKLQGFRGDVIHGKCKERFLSFMHRVMATEFADRENPASKMVELLTVDCLAELSPTLTAEIPLFSGSELVFLDVPKDWTQEDLKHFLKIIKGINIRNNVRETRYVMFPVTNPTKIQMKQVNMMASVLDEIQLGWDIAYYQYSSTTPKEQCLLTNSTFPFLVTRTSKIVKSNNHFSVPEDIAIKERDSGMVYKRQKPVKLYEELLEVLKADKSQHVIDACSGVASCAVACLSKDIKCVVLEKSAIKARLISQRLKQ